MERLPFVSVLLPVFNGKAYLAEALESVQRQTYKNFEIISIDDGSHDGSFDVLKSASLVDSRIRVSRQSNRGIAATTNALFAAAARATYFCLFDQDDIMLPNCIERLVEHMSSHPDAGAACGSAEFVDSKGQVFPGSTFNIGKSFAVADLKLKRELPGKSDGFINPGSLWRREVVMAMNGYREAFVHGQDFDLWMRVGERHPIHSLTETLVRYRIHDSNTHKREPKRYASYLQVVKFSALQSELGLMATSKGDLAAHREASGRSVEIAQSQVAAAKDELATMGHAITPATNVTVGEADAILRGLHSDPAWLRTANCTNVTLASSKVFCAKVADADGIRARAVRRAELEATIRDGETVLSSGAVVEVADPGSEAIADFLGSLGFGKIDKVAVAHWTVLVGVLALEVGSAFAVVLGSAMVGDGGALPVPLDCVDGVPETRACLAQIQVITPPEFADPSASSKPATIQAETRLSESETGVSHAGLSDRARAVYVSIKSGSCFTDRRTWAKELGVSTATLGPALTDLVEAGVVKISASKGRGTSVRLVSDATTVATRH